MGMTCLKDQTYDLRSIRTLQHSTFTEGSDLKVIYDI